MKRIVCIVVVLIMFILFLTAGYLYYFSDYSYATSKGVPKEAYDKYFSVKSTSLWDTNYALYSCKLKNQTKIFDVTSVFAGFMIHKYYFYSNGTEICENHNAVDCRDHCPDCLNYSVSNCTIILSNY